MLNLPITCGSSSSHFFFQGEDGIRNYKVTGVQTCALPISAGSATLLDQSNHRQPGSARVASVNSAEISGQVSAYSGRTWNLAVMKIIGLPLRSLATIVAQRARVTPGTACVSWRHSVGTVGRVPQVWGWCGGQRTQHR